MLRLPDAQPELALAVAAYCDAAYRGAGDDPPGARLCRPGGLCCWEAGAGLWDVLLSRVASSTRLSLTAYEDAYLHIVAPLANSNMATRSVGGTTARGVV